MSRSDSDAEGGVVERRARRRSRRAGSVSDRSASVASAKEAEPTRSERSERRARPIGRAGSRRRPEICLSIIFLTLLFNWFITNRYRELRI